MRKLAFAAAAALSLGTASAADEPKLPTEHWSFDGPFGTYDRAALQRGFQVYKEVCSACHAVKELYYRDLAALGFSDEEIKALAAQAQVTDGPNDQGEMFQRPGRPSDRIARPFPNDNAARAANNGALPPDLALITKAREGGPDYVFALLTGYAPAPADVKLAPGMYYNLYFPGHQIAMPPPLTDGAVTFADGTPSTVKQMAHDVTNFLSWAAEPSLEERHRTGVKVMAFLLVCAGLFYAVKRKIWANVH
jgi:ubiquinol-cytochrome c reductase cytochrome c1 subunit